MPSSSTLGSQALPEATVRGWKKESTVAVEATVPALAGAEAERGGAAVAQHQPAIAVRGPGRLAVDDVLQGGQALRGLLVAPGAAAATVRCAATQDGSPA